MTSMEIKIIRFLFESSLVMCPVCVIRI